MNDYLPLDFRIFNCVDNSEVEKEFARAENRVRGNAEISNRQLFVFS